MYGANVHRAVVESGDTETGITIHLVNEVYDSGRILFQTSVPVLPTDTPADVESKHPRPRKPPLPRIVAETLL